MAKSFSLTAKLNIQGPNNLRPVVQSIRRQLSGIRADVNVRVDRTTTRQIAAVNRALQSLDKTMKKVQGTAGGLTTSLTRLGQAQKAFGRGSNTTTRTFDQQAKAASGVTKNVSQAKTEMEEFGRISALAVRRFAAFSAGTAIIFGFLRALQEGISEAIKFERQIVRISQVTGTSIPVLRNLTNEVTRLSTTFGTSSQDLLDVSRILAQAGLTANETRKALEALAKSTLAPTFTDIQKTTEGAVAIMNQFSIEAGELEESLGAINAVAGRFAVESDDIIAAVRKTGGVFAAASANVSQGTDALNEFIALFTSVRATTRESAESIATGLRTIFSRLQRRSTIESLRELGVVLVDTENKFVGPFEAVRRLSGALTELAKSGDVRFAAITEELGGFRQVGKVIPLVTQFAKAQDALAVAQQGQESLTKDAVLAQQALAVQIEKTREKFLALIREISETSTFKVLSQSILGVANALISAADATKELLPLIAAIGTIKAFSALRQFTTGFFGGIRTSTVGGGATAQQTTATQASAAASRTLASAMLDNTRALQALTAAVKVLSTRPRTGLASGGLVPGTGNRDTFPASLTPGEFVIRKKAVERLGADNLAALNKNSGGFIPGFQIGGALTEKEFRRLKKLNALGKAIKKEQKSERDRLQKRKDAHGIKKATDVIKVTDDFGIGLLTTGASGNAENIRASASSVFNERSGPAVRRTLKDKKFDPDLVKEFVASPFVFRVTPDAKNNFTNIVEDPLQNSVAKAANATLGAARFLPPEKFSDLTSKAGFRSTIGQLFEGFVGFASQAERNLEIDDIFDIRTIKNAENFKTLFGATLGKGIPLEIKGTSSIPQANVLGKAIRGNLGIKKLAAGGSVDSVNALLTPGEFVIRKEAANKLGRSTLEKLNQADKFANGGIVGGIQKFVNGGKKTIGAVDLGEITQVTKEIPLTDLINSFLRMEKQLEQAGQSTVRLTQEFDAFLASFKQARTQQLRTLEPGISEESIANVGVQAVNKNTPIRVIVMNQEGQRSIRAAPDPLVNFPQTGARAREVTRTLASRPQPISGVEAAGLVGPGRSTFPLRREPPTTVGARTFAQQNIGSGKDAAKVFQSLKTEILGLLRVTSGLKNEKLLEKRASRLVREAFKSDTVQIDKHGKVVAASTGRLLQAGRERRTRGFGRSRSPLGLIRGGIGKQLRGLGGKFKGNVDATSLLLAGPLLEQAIGGRVGGAIGGAGIGAGIGAQFGPTGAVIGAGVGALQGVGQANIDEKQQQAQQALESSTKALSTAFEDFNRSGDLKAFQGALENVTTALEFQSKAIEAQSAGALAEGLGEIFETLGTTEKGGGGKFVSRAGGLTQDTLAGIFGAVGSVFTGPRPEAINVGGRFGRRSGAEIIGEAGQLQAAAKQFEPQVTKILQEGLSGKTLAEAIKALQDDPELRKAIQVYLTANSKEAAAHAKLGQFDEFLEQQLKVRGPGGDFTEDRTLSQLSLEFRGFLDNLKGSPDQIKLLEDAFKKSNEATKTWVNTLDVLSAQIKRAVESGQRFTEANRVLAAEFGGGTAIQRQNFENPFANIQAFSPQEISGAFSGLEQQLGFDTSVLQGFVLGAKKLETELPKIFADAADAIEGDPLAPAESNIFDRLRGLNVPPEILQPVIKNLEAAFGSRQKGGPTGPITAALEKSGKEFTDQLSKLAKRAPEISAELVNALKKISDDYRKGLGQFVNMSLQLADRQIEADLIRVRGFNRRQRAVGREPTFQDLTRERETRLTGLVGAQRDPRAIVANIQRLRKKRKGLLGEAEALPVGSEQQKQLLDRVAGLSTELGKNKKALEFLSRNTIVLAAAEQELAQLQKKRQQGRNLIQRLTTADATERGQILQQITAAQGVFAGQQATGIQGQAAFGGLDLLKQAGIIGEKETAQFFKTQAGGPLAGLAQVPGFEKQFGLAQTERGATPEEQNLLKIFDANVKDQIDATKGLTEIMKQAAEAFKQNIGDRVTEQAGGARGAAIDAFGESIQKLQNALTNVNVPERIEHGGNIKHEIVINGAEVLARLEPMIQDIAINAFNNNIGKFVNPDGSTNETQQVG